MSAPAIEAGARSARVQRARARRRLVETCDRAALVVAGLWATSMASGAFLPSLDSPPGCSAWFMTLGIALVLVVAVRRRFDPVTPLREVPLMQRTGELAAGGWLTSPWVVRIAFVVVALLAAGGSIGRHRAFAAPGGELALFENVLWNSVHGRFGMSSFLGDRSLALPFGPLLAVLAIPYALVPRAETLLVIQALAVAASVFPFARLARREIAAPFLVNAFVVAQAAYLPLRSVARADFVPALLATPLLLECVVALREGRTRRAICACAGALACSPAVAPAAAALGLFAAVAQRRGALGAALVGIAVVWGGMVVGLTPGAAAAADRLVALASLGLPAHVGAGPTWNLPMLVSLTLAPLAFLPLFAPAHAMLALPSLVLAGLGAARGGASAGHLAVATPFLLVAAVQGASLLIRRDDLRTIVAFYPTVAELERYLAALLLVAAGVFIGWSPIADVRLGAAADRMDRQAILAGLPAGEAVSAQGNLAAHLARRRDVRLYPDHLAPWVVVDGGRWSQSASGGSVGERSAARLRATVGCRFDEAKGAVERYHCDAAALRSLESTSRDRP